MISMDTKQVKELTGLTDNQITYLIKKVDALKREKSQGKAREYTFRELVYLKLASLMRSDGIRLDEINEAIGTLDYFLDVTAGYMKDGVFIKQREVSYRGGILKARDGTWSYGLGEYYDDDVMTVYFDPKEGKEGSYKMTKLTHVPGLYYNVRAIATELAKGDQLELGLMSEVEAVH